MDMEGKGVTVVRAVYTGQLHCVPKKEATKLWAVTLPNLNRF